MSIRHKDEPVRARRSGGLWYDGIIVAGPNRAAAYKVYFPFFFDQHWIGIEDLEKRPTYNPRTIQNYRNGLSRLIYLS